MPERNQVNIITLVGSNDFTLHQYLVDIISNFTNEYGSIAVEHIECDNTSLEHLQDSLLSPPFLSPKKMLLLREPSQNQKLASQFEQLIKQVPDTTEVVVVDPKIDKRTSLYKILKKQTGLKEFNPLLRPQLINWLVNEAKLRSTSMPLAVANHLIERVGENQNLLFNELNKLVLYNQKIDNKLIDLLIEPTPQSSIFELLDAALSGQTKRSLSLYREQRQLKVEPKQIIAMLTWQLHIIALIKAAKSSNLLSESTNLKPFVIEKSSRLARGISMAQLKATIGNLLKLDSDLKSKKIEADEALEYYLLTLNN
ncbi:MAG TPA: DNA polymerase III subunit delta [Patescibacteria group bacterium]|jgi:DNA polymerase-3 subunit delta|nr:DNA polymerase III subunit delta [Patescibacteria group bacterium]